MNFNQHINKETETIKTFELAVNSKTIKIRKIFNESFSSYDFVFTYKEDYIYFTEVKTRSVKDTQYPDTILEQMKIDKINEEIKEANKIKKVDMEIRAGFLVQFTNGMYFFDLVRTPTTTSIKKCPKHTASDGNNYYIYKKLVHFKIQDGKKII